MAPTTRKKTKLTSGTSSNQSVKTRKIWGPLDPCGAFDSEGARFLRCLYAEIHAASQVAQPRGKDDISAILRRVRSRRFWKLVQPAHQLVYSDDARMASRQSFENDTVADRVRTAHANFREDIAENTHFRESQLEDMVETVGYPMLSICLHSPSFLAHMSSDFDEYRHLEWEQKLELIETNAASLELFAKLRGLDFWRPLRAFEEDFELLTLYLFTSYPCDAGRTFGIQEEEMDEIHDLKHGDQRRKHWALPLNSAEPAQACTITYRVTADLIRDFPEYTLDQERTDFQEEVEDSIFLRGYQWPNLAQFPSDDPREDGYEWPCHACNKQRGAVPKSRNAAGYPSACGCSLTEVQNKFGMGPSVLYEIVTTRRLGKGLRALQNFEADDPIGVYVGEMYPLSRLGEADTVKVCELDQEDSSRQLYRYDGDAGVAYIMDQYTSRRHARAEGKKKRASGDDAVRTTAMLPLAANEWKRYAVDAAVKGNFTRFANHSCDPNLRFSVIVLGQKTVTLMWAKRDIAFGEMLTVDYGERYFIGTSFACRCGVSTCHLWNQEDKETETRTLAEAIRDGDAPDWVAADEDQLPLTATKIGLDISKERKRRIQRIRRKRAAEATKDATARGHGGDNSDDDDGNDDNNDRRTGGKTAKVGSKSARSIATKTTSDAKTPAPPAKQGRQTNNSQRSRPDVSPVNQVVQGTRASERAATKEKSKATREKQANNANRKRKGPPGADTGGPAKQRRMG